MSGCSRDASATALQGRATTALCLSSSTGIDVLLWHPCGVGCQSGRQGCVRSIVAAPRSVGTVETTRVVTDRAALTQIQRKPTLCADFRVGRKRAAARVSVDWHTSCSPPGRLVARHSKEFGLHRHVADAFGCRFRRREATATLCGRPEIRSVTTH